MIREVQFYCLDKDRIKPRCLFFCPAAGCWADMCVFGASSLIKMCILDDFCSLWPRCGPAATTSTARALTARRRWTKRWVSRQNEGIRCSFCCFSFIRPSEQTAAAAGHWGSRLPPAAVVLLSNLFSFLSTCKSWQISSRDRSPI